MPRGASDGSSTTDTPLVAGGLLALIVGAEVLVRAGTGLASWLGIRPMMIGLTVDTLGTSVPELGFGSTLRSAAAPPSRSATSWAPTSSACC